jgi:ubiquinone/menaquinone biosynthesis C-methylase UbiE
LPQERVLDIGCGCGLIALILSEQRHLTGIYTGVDIHHPSIQWCQEHLSRQYPNFTFKHIDVKNQMYNPHGKYAAEDYTFPLENRSLDVILLKSVFTHMRPQESDNYLKEISRLLSNKGRCLATFFLLNSKQADLAKEGKNSLDFKYGNEQWRYVYESNPESAIAYPEDFVKEMCRKHNLSVKGPIYYGTWTGLNEGLSYQDILILEKAG